MSKKNKTSVVAAVSAMSANDAVVMHETPVDATAAKAVTPRRRWHDAASFRAQHGEAHERAKRARTAALAAQDVADGLEMLAAMCDDFTGSNARYVEGETADKRRFVTVHLVDASGFPFSATSGSLTDACALIKGDSIIAR